MHTPKPTHPDRPVTVCLLSCFLPNTRSSNACPESSLPTAPHQAQAKPNPTSPMSPHFDSSHSDQTSRSQPTKLLLQPRNPAPISSSAYFPNTNLLPNPSVKLLPSSHSKPNQLNSHQAILPHFSLHSPFSAQLQQVEHGPKQTITLLLTSVPTKPSFDFTPAGNSSQHPSPETRQQSYFQARPTPSTQQPHALILPHSPLFPL